MVLGDLPNSDVYLDYVVVYFSTWADHISILHDVFSHLAAGSLTSNLVKCEIAKASVTYLGKPVGNSKVHPVDTKVNAILVYPIPTTQRKLQRFLGMAGY